MIPRPKSPKHQTLTYRDAEKARRPTPTASDHKLTLGVPRRSLVSKSEHLQWMTLQGVPDLHRKLMVTTQQVTDLEADKSNLEAQIDAIGMMQGASAHENARRRHLPDQIEINQKLLQTLKTKGKLEAAMASMRAAQLKIRDEITKGKANRLQIKRSTIYKPKNIKVVDLTQDSPVQSLGTASESLKHFFQSFDPTTTSPTTTSESATGIHSITVNLEPHVCPCSVKIDRCIEGQMIGGRALFDPSTGGFLKPCPPPTRGYFSARLPTALDSSAGHVRGPGETSGLRGSPETLSAGGDVGIKGSTDSTQPRDRPCGGGKIGGASVVATCLPPPASSFSCSTACTPDILKPNASARLPHSPLISHVDNSLDSSAEQAQLTVDLLPLGTDSLDTPASVLQDRYLMETPEREQDPCSPFLFKTPKTYTRRKAPPSSTFTPPINPELLHRADSAKRSLSYTPVPVAKRLLPTFNSSSPILAAKGPLTPCSYIRSTITPLTLLSPPPSSDNSTTSSPDNMSTPGGRPEGSATESSPPKASRYEDLDETLIGDASMNSDPGHTEGQANQNGTFSGQSRQKTTSESSTTTDTGNGPPSAHSTPGSHAGSEHTARASRLVDPRLEKDMDKVRKAVEVAGGLMGQHPPDFSKLKARDGEKLEVIQEWFNFEDEDFDDIPARPDENTLRKITADELLPPPSDQIVPLDFVLDGQEHSFVANQRIEFLVLRRPVLDSDAPWDFPSEEQLRAMYSAVRQKCDHDLILDVCQYSRVDPKTGIATMMLSTVDLALMLRVRHEVRVYMGHMGYKYETYSKSAFMKKYGITMYIQRENGDINPYRILRTLFYKYRHLKCNVNLLSRRTFLTDRSDKPSHRRSRIGDMILLLDGPQLYEKLRNEDENTRYFLSQGFSVTLKGGFRGPDATNSFAHSFASNVIVSNAEEAMNQAHDLA